MSITVSQIIGILRHLPHGPKIAAQYLRNASRTWNSDLVLHKAEGTSLSDADLYTSIVIQAVDSDAVFSKFRSNAAYLEILDHVSYRSGRDYLDLLESHGFSLDDLSDLQLQGFSEVGSPLTYPYGAGNTQVSPTLLRYLKVSKDLKVLFGDLDGRAISEIGVGYGGQAAVLAKVLRNPVLQLFDLPEVLRLAGKFLSAVGVNADWQGVDGRKPVGLATDLVISNYAFSELNREIQESYLREVLLKSPMGYVTWNQLSQRGLDGMSEAEFLGLVPGSEQFAEVPLTAHGNSIIAWGHRPGAAPLGC